MNAHLIARLRWDRWSPDEAATLARRHTHAELCRRHLDAAYGLYDSDRDACRWQVERMTAIRRREWRHD